MYYIILSDMSFNPWKISVESSDLTLTYFSYFGEINANPYVYYKLYEYRFCCN